MSRLVNERLWVEDGLVNSVKEDADMLLTDVGVESSR